MASGQTRKKTAADATGEAEATPRRRAAHVARSGSAQNPVLLLKDAERTKAEILKEATREFARKGFSGGRINEIVKRTRTSKRMIYYYFGSKKGLYKAVLFEHYRRLRTDEQVLKLDELPPLVALERLVHFTFDWYVKHAAEVPLVMVENIHHAAHVADLPSLEPLNTPVIELVERIYKRGLEDGSMRPGLRPIDIYLPIAANSFFNISNRYTFKAVFGHDLLQPKEIKVRREAITDLVRRYVQPVAG